MIAAHFILYYDLCQRIALHLYESNRCKTAAVHTQLLGSGFIQCVRPACPNFTCVDIR